MANEGDEKYKYIKIDTELHKVFKARSAERGTSLQDAATEAVSFWTAAEFPRQWREDLLDYARFLREATQDERNDIVHSIALRRRPSFLKPKKGSNASKIS